MMEVEKKALSLEEIEAQTALELPDREMLALVGQVGLVNVNVGPVTVSNNTVNVCANVIANNSSCKAG